jgi:hypothetical protein
MRFAALCLLSGLFLAACAGASEDSTVPENDDFESGSQDKDSSAGKDYDLEYRSVGWEVDADMESVPNLDSVGWSDAYNTPEDGELLDGSYWCDVPVYPGSVIFSEYFTRSASHHGGEYQWVELLNTRDEPVCLEGCRLEASGKEVRGFQIHQPEPVLLEGRGVGLVGGFGLRDIADQTWPVEFTLPTYGGKITLLNRLGQVVDTLQFGSSQEFLIPPPEEGKSVYLCGQCLSDMCSTSPDSWSSLFHCMPPDCIDMPSFDVFGNLGTPKQHNPDCTVP